MQPLQQALGGLARINQFFVWRLEWNATDGKYDKRPYDPKTGAPMERGKAQDNPAQWMSYDAAVATVQGLNGWGMGTYALGFWLTADTGYWFLDLDKHVETDGTVSTLANEMLARFPGACGEYSSSASPPQGVPRPRAGLHLFGRGQAPQHTTKNGRLGLEFYTDSRGVAFGLTGQAWGNADTVAPADALAAMCDVYFRISTQSGEACMSGPRADWRGPEDDQQLLALAFSRKSAAAAFGSKASLEQLMRGNRAELYEFFNDGSAMLESEADMALCAHLAYWTGCDVRRMERICRMSGLYRAKWDEQRPLADGTYVSWIAYTAYQAAQTTERVLQVQERAERTAAAVGLTVAAESVSVNSDWVQRVQRCTEEELRNTVVPAIAADASIGELDRDRLASLVKERFKLFGFPMTIAKARALLAPPRTERNVPGAPEWAHSHVYVLGLDKFYDMKTGALLSRTAFGAQYDRLMPVRDNGKREDAAQWCLEHWGTSTVHALIYWPGKPALFEHDGQQYANMFSEEWQTPCAPGYTEQGVAGIQTFTKHLWNLCSERQEVYNGLLTWLAHNVQHPGRKIRFAPLVKGIQGDGKSMLGDILAAAIGRRHVKVIGSDAFTDRFTDWGHGGAVGVIEEIMMTGRERYFVANKVRPFITNDTVAIRPLGSAVFNAPNTMNYIALTNHSDAVPLEEHDRRWWIIFSPFTNAAQLDKAYGGDAAGVFATIFDSLRDCPGEWRRWLLEYPIPDNFNPNGRAPDTEEKHSMRASGTDESDTLAASIIEDGAFGVTSTLLSSNELTKAMNSRALTDGYEVPKSTAVNHMLARMGWSQHPKLVKWGGRPHRVWTKGATYSTPEQIRAQLDATKGAR